MLLRSRKNWESQRLLLQCDPWHESSSGHNLCLGLLWEPIAGVGEKEAVDSETQRQCHVMSCVKMKVSFVLIQYVLIDALLSWLEHLSIPQVAGWCMQMGYIPIPRHTACSYRSSVPSALFFRVLSISNVCLSALNRWSRGRSSHSISGRIWHQGSS
jgi:hypothetical protein